MLPRYFVLYSANAQRNIVQKESFLNKADKADIIFEIPNFHVKGCMEKKVSDEIQKVSMKPPVAVRVELEDFL